MHLLYSVSKKQKTERKKILVCNFKATDKKSRIRNPVHGSKDRDPSQRSRIRNTASFQSPVRKIWLGSKYVPAWRSKDPDLLKKWKSVDHPLPIFFYKLCLSFPVLCIRNGFLRIRILLFSSFRILHEFLDFSNILNINFTFVSQSSLVSVLACIYYDEIPYKLLREFFLIERFCLEIVKF
jgi:hypothetical protein